MRKIERDLARALLLLGLSRAELSVLFVNSERMRRLNARFRGIDRSTDVLSFPLLDSFHLNRDKKIAGPLLLGDIVICVPKALLQAKEERITFHRETLRLLVHGLLHLIGYDHEINAYQRRKMENKEKELLDAL